MTLTSKNAIKTVSLGKNRYGYTEPQVEIRFPAGTNERAMNATLFRLAAEIELATSERERWVVRIENPNNSSIGSIPNTSGRVCLKLATVTFEEEKRAMAMLRKLVGQASDEWRPTAPVNSRRKPAIRPGRPDSKRGRMPSKP